MESDRIIVLSLALSLLAFGLIAKWYVMPPLRARPRAAALTPLLLLHGFRHVGLVFLVGGVVSPALAPSFAVPAAYGDLLAAVLALLALWALRLGSPLALPLVWIFNVEGTLDLLYAIYQGLVNGVASKLGAAYFIPAVVVPALLVTHFMIFQLLAQRGESEGR
ncbi:MAG: hypothetical protein ACE5IM_06355 [Nitrospinota bacterium]